MYVHAGKVCVHFVCPVAGDLEQELMGLKKPKSKKDKVVTVRILPYLAHTMLPGPYTSLTLRCACLCQISDVPLAEPGEPADDDVLAVSAFLTTVDFSLPKKKKRRRPVRQ